MARRDKEEAQGFLSRWSQRKRAAEETAETPAEPASAEGGGAPGPAEQEAVDPATLPDIDTLDAGSDFTVFMRKGVPEALKRRALRKLWQVDPAFHHICMLDDYNLDYTDAATVVPNLKTIYQVGRGMVLPDEDVPEAAQTTAAETAPEAAPAQELAVDGETPATDAVTAVPADDVAEPRPRQARKPGTPLVASPPNRGAMDRREGRPTPAAGAGSDITSSARRRRWGDTDA